MFDKKPQKSDELLFALSDASDASDAIRRDFPDAERIWGGDKGVVPIFEKIFLEDRESESSQLSAARAVIAMHKQLGAMRGMFDDRLGALDAKMRLAEADIANPYLASRTVAAIKKCRTDFERIRADIKTASIGGDTWNELSSRLLKLEDFWGKLQRTAIDFDLRHGPENAHLTEKQILDRMCGIGRGESYLEDAVKGWRAGILNKGDLLQNEAGMKNAKN